MAEYRLSPQARRDIDEVFEYIVARWGLRQAMGYIDLVEAACADLAEAPHQSQGCDDIRQGYRRRSVGRHVIYLRPTTYGIAVIRILHQRMDASRHL